MNTSNILQLIYNNDTTGIKIFIKENPDKIHENFDMTMNTGKKCKINALNYAINKNNIEAVKLLLDAGADPNFVTNIKGNTPLFLSFFRRNYDITKLLIHTGANPYKQNYDGKNIFNLMKNEWELSKINELLYECTFEKIQTMSIKIQELYE